FALAPRPTPVRRSRRGGGGGLRAWRTVARARCSIFRRRHHRLWVLMLLSPFPEFPTGPVGPIAPVLQPSTHPPLPRRGAANPHASKNRLIRHADPADPTVETPWTDAPSPTEGSGLGGPAWPKCGLGPGRP